MSRLTDHLDAIEDEPIPANPLPPELPEGDPSEVEDDDDGE